MNFVEMYAFSRWKTKKCMVQALVLFIVIVLSVIFIWPISMENVVPLKSFYSRKSYKITFPDSENFYSDNCFDRMLIQSIDGLLKNADTWSKAYDRKCQVLWKKFQLIYRVENKQGQIFIPKSFWMTVFKWLGNSTKLVASMENQNIHHVFNQYTHEYTVYNALRSKRPVAISSNNIRKFVNELSNKTKANCDFCKYKTMTAEDVFGRIVGKHSGSAANSFKLDKWHSLFLTEKHNPLELNEEDFLDWFNTSLEWFRRTNAIDNDAIYPMMIWDSLPHAGASQFHPHIHGILGEHHYHGSMANQLAAARAYNLDADSDYWTDLVEIHVALGLAVQLGEAVAIATLSAVKDYELLLLSSTPCNDLFRLLFYVVRTYHQLDRFCYSSGMALPVLDAADANSRADSLPAVIRIGTRGQCDSAVSDASSLELFLMYNVNVDPYTVIARLRDVMVHEEHASSNK